MTAHRTRQSSILQRILEILGMAALGLSVLLTGGCGGGGSFNPSAGTGDVSISLTDSIGDFASYTVDVTSLQLVKQNGTQVSALPTAARVDFSQYTDLSEFLTVASVPSGTYTQVVLNLDYSNADVEVQDAQGIAHKATLVDSDGKPLTTLSVTLDLASGAPLVIAPGIPASLALDFDLSASNQVISTNPYTVQVEPFLTANLSLDTSREHRARGLLKDVDSATQTFEMHLRPFAIRQREWGLITVNSASTTQYEIDGVSYEGATGLTQLAALPADTPLIVTGTIAGKKLLDATEVLAGSSVPWASKDVVQGTVIKRAGDTLTVRGHYINRTDGIAVFNSDIAVTVDGNTKVTAPLLPNPGTLTKDSVSVGQAVTAFGTLNLNSSPYELDSTGSGNLVRMDVTQLKGTVSNQTGTLLTANLAYINGRRIGIFDFTGTNSDPAAYNVDTTGLTLANIVNDIVKIRGFAVPFGQAGASDFSAISVIDLNQDTLAADLAVGWLGGTTAPFISNDSSSIVLNLASVTSDNLWLSGVPVGLGSATTVNLAPTDPNSGCFAIKQRGQTGITLYQKFADFSAALSSQLSGGAKISLIIAHGRYSAANTTLTGSAALVLLTR